MSTIERTLVLNPVEPAPISMKFHSGLETKVRLQYFQQNGAPYNTDFSAQMYLISRSSKQVRAYRLPATDLVNGRATAFIPAGDINDPNGYNVQIIGTVSGEPRLIARGSASVYETEALGILPFDETDDVDLAFAYNDPVEIDIAVWKDASGGAAYDLTAGGVAIVSSVYASQGGVALTSFTTTVLDANHVRLSLTEAQVNALPPKCWWALRATSASGVTTLAEGDVTISGVAIPGLTAVTYNWNYVKPATPAAVLTGQLVQSNVTLDRIDVAQYDMDSIDRLNTLRAVEPGDEIQIDTQIWTVQGVLPFSGYYSFIVVPAVQAAVVDVQPVTFRRP